MNRVDGLAVFGVILLRAMSQPRKHVIFLGAGASYWEPGGYPLANELRLLMSSRDHFQARLVKAGAGHTEQTLALHFFDQRKESIDLFR